MKLKEKIRDKGKVHRKYDTPKTPYQRIKVMVPPSKPWINAQKNGNLSLKKRDTTTSTGR